MVYNQYKSLHNLCKTKVTNYMLSIHLLHTDYTPVTTKNLLCSLNKFKTKLNCSEVIESWTDSPLTIIPVLKKVMANGIRVWIFRFT